MRKRGDFYESKGEHGCSGVILCTNSNITKSYFEGVCVKKGNNIFVGQVSKHWTKSIFINRIDFPVYEPLLTTSTNKENQEKLK